ncbi:ATP synthase F1 subunit gamma [Candidatus Absconditicoccus praedator]|uniref:ATP synthase F1 subunit gamma n=1 Tax=Candidatus Absconditicoccus praedator TaxID=2735562 RepID=UPI001E657478|nr:ATP synthase F1 subunit gamma [Candidatus Absconditicoccus praedator]UFX82976.1 ATP synthase F1 subunit gamma [Candidatus Absconditicoccus praedator]
MANLNQIKSKIKSVKNLKKITRALEVVSTVRLQKNKDKAAALKNYLLDLMFILNNIGQQLNLFSDSSSASKKLIILVTTDRGLCGALNSKIIRQVDDLHVRKNDDADYFVIGKKGLEYANRMNLNIVGQLSLPDNFSNEDLIPLFDYIESSLDEGYYGEIKVYFNYFKNSLIQVPTNIDIYPLKKENFHQFLSDIEEEYDLKSDLRGRQLIIEPDVQTLEKEIKRQIRSYMILSALIQNKTGEFASRMIAMKNAKDNSESTINNLTLTYNKTRQGMITQEISEITGATSAME